ncbi:hypothetical protein FA09DRAFT_341416 [Tilletiopsis washingtonensis]|uniref:Uncharacterized protein n=1 Tax=Tilletiopsis washingtonensis TaxID=58919 RepID=A0A316Z294_9BASI|nr:hypothetical protein FA09DRAFT_341416 [Tilletiopsis washingtonensis]PWN95214.1 hypothetical protein FA09DRAFT_341416 [Tilletiopsis washingtonensis]
MAPKKRAAAPSPVPSAATGTPAQAQTLLRRSNEAQAARKRSTWKGLFFALLVRVGVFYTLIAALWHCSSTPFAFDYNPRDSRQVCRTLAQGKATLGPHAAAIWRDVEMHLQPYTAPVAPYVRTATRVARPYVRSAQRRGAQLWRKHGEPLRKQALKQGRKYVDPHVKTARTHYRKSVQPHLDTASKAVKPYRDIYSRDVHPYLTEAGALSLGLTQQAYHLYNKQVQPRLITSAKAAHRFHRQHVDPAARRGYSLYVQPQADRVLAYLFNRKARAVSNDAISKAKTSSDEARQHGESKAKEAVKEADDPSIIDRLNKARDAVTGKVPSHEDPVQAAALDAELAAEQETVKTELEAWETGMLKLIEQEYRLVTERVAELRNRRLADLPDRFATLTESFVDDEVASALARLDRTYKKLSVDSSSATLAERIESGNAQTQAQRTRLSQSHAALEAQLQSYQDELDSDERAAIAAGTAEVGRFADEAGRAYAQAMKRAKFEATEEEWSGWDKGLKVRAEMFGDECEKLRLGQKSVRPGIGATDLAKEPKLEPRIAELRKSTAKLYSAADSELASYARSGSLQLRGEGVRRTVGEATDNVQNVAQQLTEGAAAAMLGAAAAARARLGLAPSDQGILARVASQASSAAGAATSGAASAAGQARSSARSAASAAGVSVSPEGAREHIESAYGAAASGAGNVYSSVVAAVQPSTTGAFQAATSSVGSVYESLASAASSASSSYLSASTTGYFEAATSSVGSVYESVASAAADASSSYLKPSTTGYFEAATSSVGSIYEELASSAADASSSYLKPSTTGYFEAATSSVGSAYESAASAASSLAGAATTPVAQRVYDAAGNVYSDASASAASVYSDVAGGNVGSAASSALRQATRSVASAAGYSPSPETPGEYLEAGRERVADAAQAVYSAVGGGAYADSKLPGRHAPREDYNHIGKAAAAGAAKVADAASPYADSAASVAREASRSVASAAGVDVEPTNAAEWISSAASRATAAVAGTQGGVVSSASSLASSLSSVAAASISSASSVASASASSVSKVAGSSASSASSVASASSSSLAKVAASSISSASSVASASSSSLAKAAAASYSSAYKAAASAAGSSPLSSASSAASSASKRAAASASSASKEAQSSLSSASKAAASAVGDSPLSSASSAVSAAAAAVASSASSLSSSFSSATRSEKVAAGISVEPEGAVQSVYSAAAEAASSISSFVQPAAASTGVVDQARSAASSVASRVREEL